MDSVLRFRPISYLLAAWPIPSCFPGVTYTWGPRVRVIFPEKTRAPAPPPPKSVVDSPDSHDSRPGSSATNPAPICANCLPLYLFPATKRAPAEQNHGIFLPGRARRNRISRSWFHGAGAYK
jgi:hypothetical protein